MGMVRRAPERWTRSTVYPDMWLDPDEDPRNSDGVSPDGELATLLDYLADYRLTLLLKCEGLDAQQLARRSVPPSTMSLLGLLRHLAAAERDWRNWIMPDDPLPKLHGGTDADFDGAIATNRSSMLRTPTWLASRPTRMRRWPHIRIWVSASALRRWRFEKYTFTGSRSTPVTAGTRTCCASASTAA
jgi:Protein of unknown function (DUF664)